MSDAQIISFIALLTIAVMFFVITIAVNFRMSVETVFVVLFVYLILLMVGLLVLFNAPVPVNEYLYMTD